MGQPQGAATSKTIGPEGGTISTADGNVQLSIPAGAVSKATDISIQPITNYAPNGLGLAYRFSPDGTQFAKPATLTFRYKASTVAANDPDLLRVAFQRSDRRWQSVAGVSVDTASRQISVPMPHFSDWSAYEIARISSLDIDGGSQLDFGASTTLELDRDGALLEPLYNPNHESLNVDFSNLKWSVAGGSANGHIKVEGDKATYTAPGSYPPQNPVAVVAEVSFKDSKKKVFLIKRILIGQDYFTCAIGGKIVDWKNISCSQLGKSATHLSGYNTAPDQSLNINLFAALQIGTYQYDIPPNSPGSAWGEFSENYGGNGGYLSSIIPCSEPPRWQTSAGGVTITQIDEVGGQTYVRGRVSGTYYKLEGDCPAVVVEKTIQGEFRIKATLPK